METILTLIGGILGALGVGLGAFGAHGLKRRLTAERLETFETAVRYHMFHSLAILAAVFAGGRWPASPFPQAAGWLFIAGIVLFSGSLYALVASGKRWWGAITPLGGVAFIAGWICLALSAL